MAFSVSRSRPFRSLGLYKSSGKHAAPKGYVPEPGPAAEAGHAHRPAHAATMPRLTSSPADASPAATGQQAPGEQDPGQGDTGERNPGQQDPGQQAPGRGDSGQRAA
jgi:hypothetical protein